MRYSRQTMLAEIGKYGQEKLRNSSMLVVGAGGLGSPLLMYLVSAGVGRISLVDDDKVSISNLQRQILYAENDLGFSKAERAFNRLKAMNSDCNITFHNERFTSENAERIATGHDIIIDGSDNLSTRYVLDNVSKKLNIPYLYGAVSGWRGQFSLFNTEKSGSYSDLFPDFDSQADTVAVGVVGCAVGITASFMAAEAIKYVLGIESDAVGHLVMIDSMNNTIDKVKMF